MNSSRLASTEYPTRCSHELYASSGPPADCCSAHQPAGATVSLGRYACQRGLHPSGASGAARAACASDAPREAGVAIGIYEWIVCRFRGLSDDPFPFDLAEGAWCANVDRAYMEYLELRKGLALPRSRPDLSRPHGSCRRSTSATTNPRNGSPAPWLSRLALHVVPEPAVLEQWLDVTVERVATF